MTLCWEIIDQQFSPDAGSRHRHFVVGRQHGVADHHVPFPGRRFLSGRCCCYGHSGHHRLHLHGLLDEPDWCKPRCAMFSAGNLATTGFRTLFPLGRGADAVPGALSLRVLDVLSRFS